MIRCGLLVPAKWLFWKSGSLHQYQWLTGKIVFELTHNVSSGTLMPAVINPCLAHLFTAKQVCQIVKLLFPLPGCHVWVICVEVGLNVIRHLKQSMDNFAPDLDEHYDLEPAVARPVLSAFDRFAIFSHARLSVDNGLFYYCLTSIEITLWNINGTKTN